MSDEPTPDEIRAEALARIAVTMNMPNELLAGNPEEEEAAMTEDRETARQILVRVASEHGCCYTEEEATELVNAYAHELAEKLRTAAEQFLDNEAANGYMVADDVTDLIDLIDPKPNATPPQGASVIPDAVHPVTPDEWPGMAAGARSDIVRALERHFVNEGDTTHAAARAEALMTAYDQWQRKAVLKAAGDHMDTEEFCLTVPSYMCDGGADGDYHQCMDWAARVRRIADPT